MTRLGQFDQLVLPKGERLIWQGRPDAWALALRVFHVRLVAGYFALLFAVRFSTGVFEQQPLSHTLAVGSRLIVPLTAVLALLSGLAFLYSRTTRYSVTSRRVLIQFGAVLPMTLNVPLALVTNAAVKQYADGTGDLPLSVASEQRLAFLLLWPHARPWKLARVQPMLRCVPDVRKFADLLATALSEASPQSPEPLTAAMPLPRPPEPTTAVASAA